jgi:hypothetical protein
VRKNWKSKNFDPKDDPTKYDSSTDSDYGSEGDEYSREESETKSKPGSQEHSTSPYKSPEAQRKKEMIDRVKQAVNERQGSDAHVIDFTKHDSANPNLNSVMPVERQLQTLKAI